MDEESGLPEAIIGKEVDNPSAEEDEQGLEGMNSTFLFLNNV